MGLVAQINKPKSVGVEFELPRESLIAVLQVLGGRAIRFCLGHKCFG